MEIRFKSWPGLIDAGRRQTILDAALQAGVPHPHGCRTGECGGCKCRLLAGEVSMDTYDVAALPSSEKEAGLILSCRAYAKTDIKLDWLGEATFLAGRLRARVQSIEAATHDIRIIRLEPERPLPFAAGQFARMRFGNLPPRPYSMANRPDEPILEFHVRLIENGLASRFIGSSLRMGDVIHLEGPFGAASLRNTHDGPIVAAAGGTGLAPISSIVRTALLEQPSREIVVYVGFRAERDVYGEDDLRQLAATHPGLQLNIVLSDPDGPTARATGFLHERLADHTSRMADAAVYVCGPPPMVNAVKFLALEQGVAPDMIFADPFTPASRENERGVFFRGWRRIFSPVITRGLARGKWRALS
jgi:ferredoxin-NAD(P)+ reductase (naphthalene dioxygenase ferredoxin-specific)